ncbi:PAS domain S-box protein, partial [bacterium]|nr:PAS domain S-box protein [bacterium]
MDKKTLENDPIIFSEQTRKSIKKSSKKLNDIPAEDTDLLVKNHLDEPKEQQDDLKYQKIVEFSPNLIVVHDLEGRIRYMNSAGRNLLRISHLDEIVNKNIHDILFHTDSSDGNLKTVYSSINNDRFKKTRGILKRKDNSTVPVEMTTVFFFFEGSPANQINAEDISRQVEAEEKRKIAEKELIRSKKDYRDLFYGMLDGFAVHEMIYDKNGEPCDYRFLKVNTAFEKMSGLKSDDIIKKRALELLPGLEKSWIERYGQVVKTGVPARFENFVKKMNKYFEVYAYRPQEEQFACVYQDITERKQMEKALRDSEKKYKTLIENVPGMIYKAYPDWSAEIICGSIEICGYTEKELNSGDGKWLSIVHPEDKDRVFAEGHDL